LKFKIWTALLLVYVIWGSTYLGIRYAVETIPPFLMAGTRFLVAGTVFYIWRRSVGDPAPTRGQWLRAAIVGVLLLVGGNGLVSFAEKNVASGVAALIVGSAPLWMTAMEALRPGGVRPNWLGILGLTVGFAGIVLLVGPSIFGGNQTNSHPAGIIILLFAALFWSMGSIYSRSADLPSSSLLSTSMEMLAGGIGLYLVGTFTGEWGQLVLANVTPRSWLGLVFLTLFGSMVGFTAYAWLMRNASVSLAATYAYVNPLIAILLGGLLAQETLNMHILLAALVIIGSVVLINASPRIKTKTR
jgi:drug/metabolite transporter (DMT)-like permease